MDNSNIDLSSNTINLDNNRFLPSQQNFDTQTEQYLQPSYPVNQKQSPKKKKIEQKRKKSKMVTPVMPEMIETQENEFQQNLEKQFGMSKLDRQLIPQKGQERLQNMKTVYINPGQPINCSDIQYCSYVAIDWQIFSSTANKNELFNLRTLKDNKDEDYQSGEFSAVKYSKKLERKKEIMYQFDHNRNCCYIKSCTGAWPCFGCCCYFCLSTIFPPLSQIFQDGQILASFTYSKCGSQVKILNKNAKLKYIIRKKGRCNGKVKYVFDSSGQFIPDIIIEDIQVKGKTKKQPNLFYTSIKFPDSINTDDRAILIYALCKLM